MSNSNNSNNTRRPLSNIGSIRRSLLENTLRSLPENYQSDSGLDTSHTSSQALTPRVPLEEFYSEEARRPSTLSFDDYRRTPDYTRDTAIEYERQNIQELIAGQTNFLGIPEEHPVPERIRFQQEAQYGYHLEPDQRPNYTFLTPVSTTVTLYPLSYPVFHFTDPISGRTVESGFPSARDHRLNRQARIILQALEVSFQDPYPDDWEDYYENQDRVLE